MATYGDRLIAKHPGRIPVVCVLHGDVQLNRTRYLVDGNSHIGDLLSMIHKHTKTHRFEAVFVFVNNTLLPNSETFYRAYEAHKNDEDGLLYVHLRKEATFG